MGRGLLTLFLLCGAWRYQECGKAIKQFRLFLYNYEEIFTYTIICCRNIKHYFSWTLCKNS